MKIDVIIPVHRPGAELLELLDRLNGQSLLPRRIILMNTRSQVQLDKLLADSENVSGVSLERE